MLIPLAGFGQTWNLNANGTWGVASNWLPASAPNGVGANATLGTIITANRVVTLAAPVTLGNLTINDNNRYTVSGSTLTFDTTGGPAALLVQGSGGGSTGHTINSAIALNDDLVVTRATGGNLDINGTIATGGRTLSVNSAASTTTRLDGAVSGTGGVVVGGAGTVVMGGAANTYSGLTQVQSGTLSLSKSSGVVSVAGDLVVGDGSGAAASAQVTIVNNGQIAANRTVTIDSDGRLTLNSSRSQSIGALQSASAAAQVVLSSGSTLTVGNGTAPAGTFAGQISGAGAFRKSGTGELILTGANTYTGATSVLAGTLSIQNSAALGSTANGTTVSDGAQLKVAGGIGVAENLNIRGTGVGGTGAIRSAGGNNTLSGSVVRAASATITTAADQLTLSGTQSGNNTLTIDGAGNTKITGNITGNTSAVVIKTGSGHLTLSGANTYGGSTEINGGTLAVSSDSNLGAAPGSPTSGHLRFGGGTLATTANMTLNANRLVTLNAGGGTISPETGTTLNYAGVISGTGGLVKSGNGTLRLSGSAGSNTYSGPTTVNAGTLALNKTPGQNAVGTGAITLNSGGTLLLENSNQIGNTTALTLAGGTFNTGTGFNETLGALSLTADSSISLGSAVHLLTFSSANLMLWSPTAILTIYGWQGIGGSPGTTGRILFGVVPAFSPAQLANIQFDGYSGGAMVLNSGELVPMAVPEAGPVLTALALLALAAAREGLARRRRCEPLAALLSAVHPPIRQVSC